MNERGASLSELMVVMAVIGIMLACAGEGFVAAASRYQAKAATTELAAELRGARHLAMTERKPMRVVFQFGTGIVRIGSVDPSGSVIHRHDFHIHHVMVESLTGGTSVTFYPSGRTATPTTITLLGPGQERRRLTVSLTGRVSLL
jgi:prepilin-type N-terminal cleavage/methylation domain-containing protein